MSFAGERGSSPFHAPLFIVVVDSTPLRAPSAAPRPNTMILKPPASSSKTKRRAPISNAERISKTEKVPDGKGNVAGAWVGAASTSMSKWWS